MLREFKNRKLLPHRYRLSERCGGERVNSLRVDDKVLASKKHIDVSYSFPLFSPRTYTYAEAKVEGHARAP